MSTEPASRNALCSAVQGVGSFIREHGAAACSVSPGSFRFPLPYCSAFAGSRRMKGRNRILLFLHKRRFYAMILQLMIIIYLREICADIPG